REVLRDRPAQAGEVRVEEVGESGGQATAGALAFGLRLEPGARRPCRGALLDKCSVLVRELLDRGRRLLVRLVQLRLARLARAQALLGGLDRLRGPRDRLLGSRVVRLK